MGLGPGVELGTAWHREGGAGEEGMGTGEPNVINADSDEVRPVGYDRRAFAAAACA